MSIAKGKEEKGKKPTKKQTKLVTKNPNDFQDKVFEFLEDGEYIESDYWNPTNPFDTSFIKINKAEISIPPEAADEKAFFDWYKLNYKWRNDPNNPYKTSDPNVKINMMATRYIIDKLIPHLPQEEQERIYRVHKIFDQVKGKLVKLKQKAFNFNIQGSPQGSLLDSKKVEIIELFGRFFNATDVHKIVTTEFGLEVSYDTVIAFRSKYEDIIKIKQDEYKRDYGDIRLTHKKSRLEELNELYQDRKEIYLRTRNKEDYKLLIQTIKDVKAEVEGDLVIRGDIHIDVEMTLKNHIHQELLRGLLLKDIIVSRVAARLNQNPLFLMSRLQNSIYAQFSGFKLPETNIEDEEPIYPSRFIYDFDILPSQIQNKRDEKNRLIQLPALSESEIEEKIDIKNDLIQRIKDKNRQVQDSKDLINKFKKKPGNGENKKE